MASHGHAIREIEIKLRITDLLALLRKISGLGARPGVHIFEQNVLYDTPDSDFRFSGRLLRLRIETPAPNSPLQRRLVKLRGLRSRAILTSKAPAPEMRRSRFKEKMETEV